MYLEEITIYVCLIKCSKLWGLGEDGLISRHQWVVGRVGAAGGQAKRG